MLPPPPPSGGYTPTILFPAGDEDEEGRTQKLQGEPEIFRTSGDTAADQIKAIASSCNLLLYLGPFNQEAPAFDDAERRPRTPQICGPLRERGKH